MLRVLVLSRTPWRTDNSFGNTYSNWFSQMEDVEIAHICLADGLPFSENNVKRYYQISERGLAKSIFKKNAVGQEVYATNDKSKNNFKDTPSLIGRAINFGKKYQLASFFLIRELVWKFGKVNYDSMFAFIRSFNPDIIFMPLYYAGYVDRVALNIVREFHIPIVLEVSLDVYTLKQLSFNPFFWINRFYVRYKTRQICSVAQMLYVISEKQRQDYTKLFDLPIKVMYKFADNDRKKFDYSGATGNIRFLYTGNLWVGRWKSLAMLVDALKTTGGTLDIYTATKLPDKVKKMLNVEGVSTVHAPIPQEQVIEEQNKSDVLVHVESFNLKNRLHVRYSISTKIMDYVSVGRCIMAIGPKDIASIEFLDKNDLALIASNEEEVLSIVKQINEKPSMIAAFAKRNENYCGLKLDGSKQRKEFREDLETISKRR